MIFSPNNCIYSNCTFSGFSYLGFGKMGSNLLCFVDDDYSMQTLYIRRKFLTSNSDSPASSSGENVDLSSVNSSRGQY